MAADDDASEASGTRPRPARGRAKRRAEPGRAEQPRKKAKQAIYWKPRDETPMESPDMRLRGEPEPVDADGGDAPQGDDGDGSQGDAEDKRPCRELSNFVLYDQNYRMRDFETLRGEGKAGDWVPEMEGVFMPIFEGDGGDDFDDDEEEEEQSSTLETGSVASDDRENWYRVSSPDQVEYFFTQEGVSIWVLTPFSWLRLLRPHSLYEHCFKDVALASRIAWRVFMLAAFAPGTPFSDFIQNRLSFPFIMPRTARPDYNVFSGQVIIPREEQVYPVELTAADVDKYAGWIVETIRLEFLDSPESFPAIKALEEVVVFNELVSISGRKKPGAEAGLKDISRPERASIPQHIREHLKKNMTLATPLVHALSRGLFNVVRPLRYPDEEDVTLAPQMELILPGLPPVPSVDVDSIAWVGEATEKLGSRTFYTAADIATVQIGTHRIQRGSWILVQGSDGATGAHQTWCGRVLYLFEDREKRGVKRCAHVRYCDLMRDTLLAEFAAPRELAILHNCDDVDLDAFLGIPDVRFVPRRPLLPSFGDSEAVLERLKARALPEEAYLPWSAHEKNWTFFYRYLWDRDEGQYLDASVFEDDWDSEPHCRSCKTCARKEAEAPAVHCIRDKVGTITGCEIGERKIFVHDFVYYVSSDQRLGDPFEIGYVETFRGKAAKLQVEVRCFKRKDEWREREIEKSTNGDNPSNKWIEESLDPDEHPVLDERELYVTNIIELVPVSDVRGICRVVHASKLGKDELDAYKDASVDNFYYEKELFDDWRREPASALIWSTRRRELMIEDENERQEFENAFRPMKSLDLFAGAGGLSKGLELSGAIETAFAVENNAHAAETFRRNFENAVVIEEDVSLFLKEFWEMAVEGKNSGHVDLTPDELAKIEFLCGGPPCKGFSSLNPYRRPDDHRNALVPTFLSVANILSILAGFKGLLLENVASFTTFPVGGHSVATKKGIRIEGGIKGGVLKFVTAALLDMDLQVRVGFLQTANHGVPQHRRRFFIIATPRSTPMMEMPVAVTTYGSAIKTVTTTLAVGPNRDIFINSYGTDRPGAPHKVPNVLSTYSDLPGFEIRDPDVFSPEDDAYTALVKRRASIYQSYDVDNAVAKGFFGKIEQGYGGPPRTNFQRLLRGDSLRLHEHVTPQVSELWARKISRVALHGGAGYFTLPQVFWDSKNGNSAKVSCPVRLSRTGLFRTISATLNPGQKQEHVVHPTQRRLLTIREIARAQGFPDSFVFHDTESQERVNVKEMVAQVGNAVPVPLAQAIGSSIKEAFFKEWKRKRWALDRSE